MCRTRLLFTNRYCLIYVVVSNDNEHGDTIWVYATPDKAEMVVVLSIVFR